MSLQVWLPLNGDLHNQGLSNITLASSGTPSIDNNGKIGKCYSFNGSSYFQSNETFLNNMTTCSLSCWVKDTYTGTSWMRIFGVGEHTRVHLDANGSGQVRFFVSKDGTTGTYWGPISKTNIKDSKWHHVCGTFDNHFCKIYIDGKCETSVATNALPTVTGGKLYLGHVRDGIKLNGALNDVRIYDHALSDKEVEEISKGLVLHYKLDTTITNGGNPNLVTGSNTNSTTNNGWVLSEQTGGSTKSIIQDENGIYCVKIQRNSTEHAGWKYLGYNKLNINSIQPDTWYTVSFDIKSNVAGTIEFYGLVQANATNFITNGSTVRNIQSIVTANQWSHIVLQIKTLSSFSGITVGSQIVYFTASLSLYNINNVMLFKNIKLEEGQLATPWCPNINDSTYTSYNNTLIPDSSGYNNNGTSVGSLETTTSSPRYSCAIKFDGSSSAIKVLENQWMAQHATEMTINIWVKNSSWSNGANMKFFSCTESGGFNCESGNSGYVRFPIYVCTNAKQTTYAYKYDSNEIQVSALTANEWNMITFVYNSTGTKTYINGQLHHTYTNTSYGIHFNTNARLFLGCEAATANPSTPYYNGQMSDFRLYYTTLTDSQIKELYNTSSTIDNKGNIYARELVEI